MAGMPYGFQAMLKEGYKHISGLNEAVKKNLEACKELSQITRTSLGPNGMNKIVINHLDKIFVTSDASVMITELEVQHPAAKLIVHAAKAQEAEIGDGTNLVITLAGELLNKAEDLLKEGLTTTEVAEGYSKASEKVLELLEGLVLPGTEELDIRDKAAVAQRVKCALSAKQNGYEDMLSQLIAEACIDVCPQNPVNFDVDNVRTIKIPGSAVGSSHVVSGMVIKRDTEGSIKRKRDAKVAVYTQGFDTAGTETKGTVLIKNADELMNYSRSEEDKMETIVKSLADAGIGVVASGMSIGEIAQHFLEKYDILAVKIPSKFDLRRFCRATNSVGLVKVAAPSAQEAGFVKELFVDEIGGTRCVVVRQDESVGNLATIVLRGATEGLLDDVERAVDDGINSYKALTKDPRQLAAGGGCELALARSLKDYGSKQPGLQQYSICAFADALEVVPRTLAENSGLDATQVVSALHAAHASGSYKSGVDVHTGEARDLSEEGLTDLFLTKWWALKLVADAVATVLRVDQIIMAKQAGGPKPKGTGGWDEE